MLKWRIITAAILIPLVLLFIFYVPPTLFCIITGLITLMAGWEWTRLMGLNQLISRFIYLFILITIFFMTMFIPIPLILMATTPFWVMALILVVAYPKLSGWWCNSIFWRGLMGMLVLVPCWVALNFVFNLGNGAYTLLYLFILIWGADTTAYFVGRKWGKTKLAPEVSPGKSVQGLIGAMVFTVAASIGVIYMTSALDGLRYWLVGLSVITVLTSVLGDLFESMMKRNVGLKDSGNLLPGHGGLLDRIDSLTAAAPVYALIVFLMMISVYY